MKIQFRIIRLPTDKGLQFRPGSDNIPLAHPTGFLWFLWKNPKNTIHYNQYILKKLA